MIQGSGIGGVDKLQSYQRLLQDARNGVNSVIQTARSLGVDVGSASANTLLPDNMTPTGFKSALSQIKNIEDKVQQAFANPSNTTNSGNGSSIGGVQFNPDGTIKAMSF